MTLMLVSVALCFYVAAVAVISTQKMRAFYTFLPIVIACAVFPRQVWSGGETSNPLPDIAPGNLQITTYVLAVATAAVIVPLQRTRLRIAFPHAVFFVALVILTITLWGNRPHHWSGVLVVAAGLGAWAVGRSHVLSVDSRSGSAHLILVTTAVILTMQMLLTIAQIAGVDQPTWLTGINERTRSIEESGRGVGTLGHPANLSKLSVLFTFISLPFMVSPAARMRRLALTNVALAFAVAGLTVSRANIFAVVVLVGLWVLLAPRMLRLRTRFFILTAGVLAALSFYEDIVRRFLEDPEGGERQNLERAVWEQFALTPFTGTGVNSYIAVVGQWDPWTATGYPVHNTFLLAAAEFGIPAAILLFTPLALLWLRAILNILVSRRLPWSLSTVFSIPATLAVTLTGWGMLSGGYLTLWMLVCGIQAAGVSAEYRSLWATRRRLSAPQLPTALHALQARSPSQVVPPPAHRTTFPLPTSDPGTANHG
ncbi:MULTISPECIES: O-antigen ligase family protein [Micrococcus]|uniref:O-antigen ligase family protein n=1 Tax=Micrococcus TaxID=1269 RepID=UPI0019D30205|nr:MULTISPECIES: O-antigen ligase family protein [Micrococcus]